MPHNAFLSPLIEAKEHKAIVTAYADSKTPRGAITGWVEYVSEEYVLLKTISHQGRPDGYRLRFFESVFCLEVNGEYEQTRHYLYQMNEQKHPALPALDGDDVDVLQTLLECAQQNRWIVRIISLGALDRLGYVLFVDKHLVKMDVLTSEGRADGTCTFDLETIQKVNFEDEQCQLVRLLARRFQSDTPDWLKL